MVKEHKHMLIQTIAKGHTKDQEIKDMLTQHMEKANTTSMVSLLYWILSISV